MKNKKGFTLIELLALIVILAIIALIATPIILNMINDARKSAAVDSAYGYIEAIDYNNAMAQLNGKYKKIDSGEVTSLNSKVKVKGTRPTSGTIEVDTTGRVIEADLCIDGFNIVYKNEIAKAIDSDKCGKKQNEDNSDAKEEITYTCDKTIYDNGTITVEKYEEICKDYIFEDSEYRYSENSDDTITLLGFQSSTPTSKDGIWALPATIGGKNVTAISSNAFNSQKVGDTLIISPTIKILNSQSFLNNGLQNIIISDSVEKIEMAAFVNNPFKTIRIGNNVTTIGNSAFQGLQGSSSLEKLIIPDSVKTLEQYAFRYIVINNLVVGYGLDIESDKFYDLTITNLTIGTNDTSKNQIINSYAFDSSNKITNLTINSSVKSIDLNAFRITNLEKVNDNTGLFTCSHASSSSPKISNLLSNTMTTCS